MSKAGAEVARDWYGRVTDLIIFRILKLDAKSRASMRRGVIDSGFYKVLRDSLEPMHVFSIAPEDQFRHILSSLAFIASLHRPNMRTGESLALIMSEPRFAQLLRSRGKTLECAIRNALKLCASKNVPVDAKFFFALWISEGRSDHDRERINLSRGFYRVFSNKE